MGDEPFERLIEPFCSGVYAGDPSKLSMKAAFFRIWNLEKTGGSLVGGALKLMQERKANPPPPRNPALPPKPAGQTVGSFRKGLQTLPRALEKQMSDHIKCNWKLASLTKNAATGLYDLVYETPDGSQTVHAKTVALTAPAYVVADLVENNAPDAAKVRSGSGSGSGSG